MSDVSDTTEACIAANQYCDDTLKDNPGEAGWWSAWQEGLVKQGYAVVQVPEVRFPGAVSQAGYFRTAADRLEGGYKVGGSNLTTAVVALLRETADAIGEGK